MFKNVNNLKEKVSDKLLVGAITLESFLANSSLASAQGTGDKVASSENYVVGAIGISLGGALFLGANELKKKGYEKTGNALAYGSFFVLGAAAAYAF